MIELDLRAQAADREFSLRASTRHSVVLIQGASGAGKTTMLRAICGLVAARGDLSMGDAVWTSRGARLRPALRIGYVPQSGGEFLGQSVRRNVELVARSPAVAERYVDACGLRDASGRRVEDLSGGQLRRMAVARALAAEPGALLFDEPFAGLDEMATQALLAVVAECVGPERPLLISSHTAESALLSAFAGAVCCVPVESCPRG